MNYSEDTPMADLMLLWGAVCAFQAAVNRHDPRGRSPQEDAQYDKLLDEIERVIAGLHNRARAML